jgi:hypothetical protein
MSESTSFVSVTTIIVFMLDNRRTVLNDWMKEKQKFEVCLRCYD